MDVRATQLRQQIEQTRAALATTLHRRERRVSRRVAAVPEQAVIGPGRSRTNTTATRRGVRDKPIP
jgi:hypothetical protein